MFVLFDRILWFITSNCSAKFCGIHGILEHHQRDSVWLPKTWVDTTAHSLVCVLQDNWHHESSDEMLTTFVLHTSKCICWHAQHLCAHHFVIPDSCLFCVFQGPLACSMGTVWSHVPLIQIIRQWRKGKDTTRKLVSAETDCNSHFQGWAMSWLILSSKWMQVQQSWGEIFSKGFGAGSWAWVWPNWAAESAGAADTMWVCQISDNVTGLWWQWLVSFGCTQGVLCISLATLQLCGCRCQRGMAFMAEVQHLLITRLVPVTSCAQCWQASLGQASLPVDTASSCLALWGSQEAQQQEGLLGLLLISSQLCTLLIQCGDQGSMGQSLEGSEVTFVPLHTITLASVTSETYHQGF